VRSRRRAPHQAPHPPPFYGWWMVWLGGFLSSLNKTAVNRGFPVFVAPVRDSFGASNAAVALIFSLARAQSGPTGLLAGWFIDRFEPRRAVLVTDGVSLGQTKQWYWYFRD
jgi:MFS family permease